MHTYRGCYHYDSSESLERALTAAREYLDDDELTDLDSDLFARFQRRGCTLLVDATLPADADRYFAVAVLGALAWHALDGVVDAYRGDEVIDRIVSGGGQPFSFEWS